MDSRTTERPIMRVPWSISPIASAGTSRRPRRKPERTASASGTSGWVPYIGASTRPTNRPRASATMKPFTLRRSKATLLIDENLFPPDEDSPAREVRTLLIPRDLQSRDGRLCAAPAAAHRDDRRRQLDARPGGGARARRHRGRRRARRGRVLRLPLRRACGRARAPGDARLARRGDDTATTAPAGRGVHGGGRGWAGADRDRGARPPRPTLQAVPQPARGRIRVDPGGADRDARHAGGRAQRAHARAAGVAGGRDRPARG